MQLPQDESLPRIIPRSEHCISRQDISDSALKVLSRLHKAGFAAYLVGGGVRDLLLGLHPKDFDVATDATPDQLKDLFRNCRLIGRRFRLAHIHFGRDIVEVATFRGHHADVADEALASTRDGMIVRDNVFGTLAEDAWRRDFSVNALYYNIADFSVVDYTGGLEDLKQRRLRMIGDPHVRCQEDPVRILRAMRFAAKLQFTLEPELVSAVAEQRERLLAVSSARLYDEVLKLFLSGYATQVLPLLRQYDIFELLFAATDLCLKKGMPHFDTMLQRACANTDSRIQEDKPVTPAFLFACLLWGPVQERAEALQQNGMSPIQALQEAGHDVLIEQTQHIALPKRFRLPIREIWSGQERLTNRRGRRPFALLEHKRFRAMYDFLLLRCEAGEVQLKELCDWWTQFQTVNSEEQKTMCDDLHAQRHGQRPRRRKSRRHND
ncbi:MAG: polynucleotide adenylyltransferase PcnB [Gammaproteobacteria bacterium]|nr:polynucleotide adenylyltransferase PcnB [Gammaproteobacteria bacterium]